MNFAAQFIYTRTPWDIRGVIDDPRTPHFSPPVPFHDKFTPKRYFPSVFWTTPVTTHFFVGLGVSSLISNPDSDRNVSVNEAMRYDHIKTLSDIYDFTMVGAYQFNPSFSLGIGFDGYFVRHFSEAYIVPQPFQQLGPFLPLHRPLFIGGDITTGEGFGFHASASFNITKFDTHIIVAYRSGALIKTDGFLDQYVEIPWLDVDEWALTAFTREFNIPRPQFVLNISQPITKHLVFITEFSYSWPGPRVFDTFYEGSLPRYLFLPSEVPDWDLGFSYQLTRHFTASILGAWSRSQTTYRFSGGTPGVIDGTVFKLPKNVYKLIVAGAYYVKKGKISIYYIHLFRHNQLTNSFRDPLFATGHMSQDEVGLKLSFNV